MIRLDYLALAGLGALACDGGLQPANDPCPTGICGTITITGTVPDSTDGVFVLAYRTFPLTCDDISGFEPLPPPEISLTGTTATYTLAIPEERYEWIVAAWKKVGAFTFTAADTVILREAGFYRDPANPSLPGAVTASGGTDGIDFAVDLDNLHPITDYLTCAVR